MKKVKFLVQTPWKTVVTGGQKYDNTLFGLISESEGVRAEECVVGCTDEVPLWKKFFREFKKGMSHSDADVVVINSSRCLRYLHLMLALRLKGRPVYAIHHHFIYKSFKGLKRLVFHLSESAFLKLASKVIIPSPYIYDEMKKRKSEERLLFWRIPFEKESRFAPDPIPGNLTYMGTIEYRKGLTYLFEALKILQERNIPYHLDIIGKTVEEDYAEKLKDYAKRHNLNVDFKGFIPGDEKERILSRTDIFVFPSLLEGFGMVLVEAQTYRLPIVSFDNSSMPYSVFNDINGYTVPTGHVKEFADAIEKIITDRQLRERFSEEAYKNSQNQMTYPEFEKTVKAYWENLSNQK